jgi:hypothetical protein
MSTGQRTCSLVLWGWVWVWVCGRVCLCTNSRFGRGEEGFWGVRICTVVLVKEVNWDPKGMQARRHNRAKEERARAREKHGKEGAWTDFPSLTSTRLIASFADLKKPYGLALYKSCNTIKPHLIKKLKKQTQSPDSLERLLWPVFRLY